MRRNSNMQIRFSPLNLSVKARISLITGFLSTLLFISGGMLWWLSNGFEQALTQISQQAEQSIQAVDVARSSQVDFKKQVQEWKNVLLRGNDSSQFEKYLGKFSKQEVAVQTGLKTLKPLMMELGIDKKPVDSLIYQHAQLGKKYRSALQLYDRENTMSAYIVDKAVKGIDRAPTNGMDGLVDLINSSQKASVSDFAIATLAGFSKTVLFSLMLIGLGVVLSVISIVFSIRAISTPLKSAVMLTNKVSEGNLTVQNDYKSADEFGTIISKLVGMASRLREAITDINQHSRDINQSGRGLSKQNSELERRTSDQAASLEEAAASLKQFSSSVQQTANHASLANEATQATQKQVIESSEVVGKVVTAMLEIDETSQKINGILSVIDDIAFQTNLLALNAAVEAARAGEQGRGFAVVASEVRNLALRSSAAAGEIKTLISDSGEKVEQGTRLAHESGQGLNAIVKQIEHATGLVNEIANSAAEQSMSVNQISQALVDIESMTQDNTALVEHVSGFSKRLQQQTDSLLGAVSFFQLGGTEPTETKAPSVPTRHADDRNIDRVALRKVA